jgi:two-component sensor histidine kinase
MGTVLVQGATYFDREPPANGGIAVSPEQGVSLRRLLEAQLAAFYKQVDVSGPEIILDPAPALSFATVINELAVNAARHGALSVSAGKVSLHWTVDEKSDSSTLLFLWEETGGPRVISRKRAGSDWTNIEEMARDLGKLRIDYGPRRLKYELEAPLDRVRFHKQKEAVK